ncbi:winged helix-turn-helix transcriptional regulator [Curtobacterium sp. Csp1]|uniref:MarR family winged helix-turn-helix transcriptional regulator n=1 Tax=Curtobacterium citreum TaxID=2036 RepID=A0ABT2HHT3_9MICO|nr:MULTISPECIES: MarR family winged helix-turn-helix transcriptional regulator [Curtobacterium]MCS6522824.1 MarR family winged helix-turn-helix transcriptional regulator [Curtobacterium citreum]QKS13703.1 winged helix-turn-helix transcriptional regulator [Curtobacterium sp. csp3]QKS20746.1 winged helix-turn-helix transcriptional regulator [Curtobacterium sp. Csp1]RDI00257.1 MarR family transcriptional regulator [Curtobacterium sp. AG1037]TQJ28732.1 MarR family transcriptional regulator [Curtob
MDESRRSDKATAVAAWEALFRAQVTVMRALNADFPSAEISFNEYDVCFNLSTQPGRRCRMRELTGHLLLTQPSVSRLVERLASKGIVEKQPDPSDARGVIVALTAHGFDVYRSVAVQHAQTIAEQVGAGLDDDELQTLTALCTKLRVAADAPGRSTTRVPRDRATVDA